MALYLKVSNNLKNLATHLCELVTENQAQQVFRPVYIVTQTDGMNNWLKYRIADRMGIAANYRYVKPHEFINKVYFLLGGQSNDILTSENLQWIIYGLLIEKSFIKRFAVVSGYYDENSPDKEVKRMALAEKIADLFDQYQVYRPELIQEWNETKSEDTIEEWQHYLWVTAKAMLAGKLPDKTNVRQYILNELKKPEQQQKLKDKMPLVYIFGLSITTGYHTQLYHAIGKHIDLNFLMLNPAPTVYWFEDKSEKLIARLKQRNFKNVDDQQPGNALLTSLGRILQDTYSLFFQDEDIINAYEEIGIEEPAGDSLLKSIQKDIFHSNTEKTIIDKAWLMDGSLTINSCYSAIREVEVLYNYLVQLTEQYKGKLSPRDIVVMVSDVEAYAPFIKAIFDNAPYKFRYAISDDKYSSGDTVSAALNALLEITGETFTAENVVQLLDYSFIRKRFGITDIGLIRDVVNKANIRFGIENEIANETHYVSWDYGLKRIMYGICMSGEEEYGSGPGSFYPLDVVEGGGSQQLIRFTHFVKVLMQNLEDRKQNGTLTQWVDFVQLMLDNMVCEPDSVTEDDYQVIQKHLENYNQVADIFTEKLPFQVFKHNLSGSLETSTRSGSFGGGGISFCSLIPMRSIPFKVVAMLGLNFDKFPRKDNTLGFNLMVGERRKGDRSTKENDKHLFMETLLSAQEHFYISYVGQNVKDNTRMPPSALVDELIDYIASGVKDVEEVHEKIITRHPLHGFSHKYNQERTPLKTYLYGNSNQAEILIKPEKQLEEFSFDEIQLHSLINFFKNPFKGYYNNVLKIFYNDEETLLEENEVFELDHLQQWALKHELLLLQDNEAMTLKDKRVKTGKLPLNSMAVVTLKNAEADIADIRKLFLQCTTGNQPVNKAFELKFVTTKLKGSFPVYGDKLVVVSFSKKECKYLLEAYIQYLAAIAAGLTINLVFISAIKNEVFEAVQISQTEAQKRMDALIKLYKEGHNNILTFYPQFDIDPHLVNDIDDKAFRKALNGVVDNYSFPCTDTYLLNEWGNGFFENKNCLEAYKHNCQVLLKPLAEIFPTYYPVKEKIK